MFWTPIKFMKAISIICVNTWFIWPVILVFSFGGGIISGVKGQRCHTIICFIISSMALLLMYGDYIYSGVV